MTGLYHSSQAVRLTLVVVVVVSIYTGPYAVGSHLIDLVQGVTPQENEFTRKILKADREKYRAIRDAKDKLIADTKHLTETVLKTIPVEIDPWP